MAYKFRTRSKQNQSSTLFQTLPAELRIQIWTLSLPDIRIISLQKYCQPTPRPVRYRSRPASLIHKFTRHTASTSQTDKQEAATIYRSHTPVPNIYAVCRESRTIVQQYYTLAFRTENSRGTWIDFKKDILYLPREICGRYGRNFYVEFPQDVKQVKYLAIGDIWSASEDLNAVYTSDSLLDLEKILVGFGNLESVTFLDAQHYKPDHTADLSIIYEETHESVEKWEKDLRPHDHPTYCVGDYLWPGYYLFGTLVDDSVEWREDKERWEQVHGWRHNFITTLSARWRSSSSSLQNLLQGRQWR